ncbi:MAG: hypothetical protein AAFX06_15415 [Planctomycetota bacterium]
MSKIDVRWFGWGVLFIGVVLSGCTDSQVKLGGYEPPITEARLLEFGKLQHIQAPVTWNFNEKTVEIAFQDGATVTPMLENVLGEGAQPRVISASWKINEQKLCLSQIEVDGKAIKDDIALELRPAGPVRVRLGVEQYNLTHVVTKEQLVGRTIEHDGSMIEMAFSEEEVRIVTYDDVVASTFAEQLGLGTTTPPNEIVANWKLRHGSLHLNHFRVGDRVFANEVSLDLSGVTDSRIKLVLEGDPKWSFRGWQIIGI